MVRRFHGGPRGGLDDRRSSLAQLPCEREPAQVLTMINHLHSYGRWRQIYVPFVTSTAACRTGARKNRTESSTRGPLSALVLFPLFLSTVSAPWLGRLGPTARSPL